MSFLEDCSLDKFEKMLEEFKEDQDKAVKDYLEEHIISKKLDVQFSKFLEKKGMQMSTLTDCPLESLKAMVVIFEEWSLKLPTSCNLQF